MKKSASTLNLLKQVQTSAESPPTVTFALAARHFPLAGVGFGVTTLLTAVASNLYHGHDIGGIPWPYISDTAKDPPQAGVFAFGMTMTCAAMIVIIVINYGKVKRELYLLEAPSGHKRNKVALVCGLLSCPSLGLLACFDTKRTPELHLYFVLAFFPCALVFLFMMTNVYANMAQLSNHGGDNGGDKARYVSLRRSLWWKRCICVVFSVFVTLSLPVGMCLVSDWHVYAKDWQVHTFRAVCQHVSVLCLIVYFGTFYFDFGETRMLLVQT